MTVPDFAGGSVPAFVTTARITQGRDNRSLFEFGLELPQSSAEDVAEGRGKFPDRLGLLTDWESVVPCRARDFCFRHHVKTGSVACPSFLANG